MSDIDAELVAEMGRITREAVDAAVAKARAEMAEELEATRTAHREYAANAEATIAALKQEVAGLTELRARVEEVAAREMPTLPEMPDVDAVAEQAASAAAEAVVTRMMGDVEAATEKADTLTAAVASLTERLASVEQREPEKGDPGVAPTADEIAAAFDARAEARMAAHLLDLERRGMDKIERAIAAMPKPKDGRDAVDVTGFRAELGEDQRTVTFSLERDGEVVATQAIRFPTLLYHGIYSEKREYAANDAVTYGGSVWIARKDAPEGKPGAPGNSDWQLAVKKGRPGRDYASTPPRAPGEPVKIGR